MGSITQMIANLEDENVITEVKKQLENGVNPVDIFKECQTGMVEVGNKFSNAEYYVSDLMMSGFIFKEVGGLIAPYLKGEGGVRAGKVVMGTVSQDIHDIGKDLVVAMLGAANFDVIDLGVDVAPETFVNTLKENPDAKVLGLSCLLTTCYDSIRETVDVLTKAGLRDKVKIMIGGGPVDQSVVEYTRADRFGKDAQDAVTICKELMGL